MSVPVAEGGLRTSGSRALGLACFGGMALTDRLRWRGSRLVLLAMVGSWMAGVATPSTTIGIGVPPHWDGRKVPYRKFQPMQMTADGIQDVVFLRGEQPWFLYGPGVYSMSTEFPREALDFTVLPKGGEAGRDAVAFAGIDGMSFCWFDEVTNQFRERQVKKPGWGNCVQVEAAAVSGFDSIAVLGLDEDLLTIRTMTLPDGANGPMIPGVTFQARQPAHCAEFFQHDDDDALEIMVLTEEGLELYETSGQLVGELRSIEPGDTIAVVREEGTQGDRLAWVTSFNNNQYLVVLDADGTMEGPVSLGNLGVVSIASGDQDDDGDDDLVLSLSHGQSLLRLWNERGPDSWDVPSFTSYPANSEEMLLHPVTPSSEYEATPAIVDLDGDGDQDVLAPRQELDRLATFESNTWAASDQHPSINRLSLGYEDAPSEDATLTITLGEPKVPPEGANAVQITVWQEEEFGTGVENTSVGSYLFHVSRWPLERDVVLPDFAPGDLKVFYLEFRLVEVDAQDNVITAFPTFVGGLSVDEPTLVALEEAPGAGPRIQVFEAASGPGWPPFLPGVEGGFVPQAGVPFFLQELLPDPGV